MAPTITFTMRPFSYLLILLVCLLMVPLVASAQEQTTKVFLITLDGLRWQELFSGADANLIREEAYVDNPEALMATFWRDDADQRREILMPFFWNTIAKEGQLHGNRTLDSKVNATNGHLFSYPGYNEILTGFSDDERINSNDKISNPNMTVLEFIHQQDGFNGKVGAFGSWDVFPYIVNEGRSGIPVNAGFRPAPGPHLTLREQLLNELQPQVPTPWGSVRLDAFTHHYALEYIRKTRPRVVYIAYGETDDFAHDAEYDAYLHAARRTDGFIEELWNWVQTDPEYRNQTTFIITTDHGRGDDHEWTSHGDDVAGAADIWLAILGPDTPALGEVPTDGQLYQNQVAATVAALLGFTYQNEKSVGEVIQQALGN